MSFVKLKDAFNLLIAAACIGGTIAGIYNVVGENDAVIAQAKALACSGAEACKPVLKQEERSPISQGFVFAIAPREASVRCHRAYYLVGEYECALR